MDFGIFWICPFFRQTHDGVRVFLGHIVGGKLVDELFSSTDFFGQ